MGTISDVLYCARDWIGYSRWTDPEEGTVFGRWFAERTGEPYFGMSGVPYCAMFASYCLDWAGVTCAGMPSAYCPDIVNAGMDAGAAVSCEDAEAGDLVLFDWGGDGLADHVGIVEENHPGEGYMTTIEGNTSTGASGSQSNGGVVARRQRGYGSVCCVVRPNYNETTEEDMGLTEQQDKLLASIYEQVTGTYDPTGRGMELNDHDHIKWVAKQCADNAAELKEIKELIAALAEKLG